MPVRGHIGAASVVRCLAARCRMQAVVTHGLPTVKYSKEILEATKTALRVLKKRAVKKKKKHYCVAIFISLPLSTTRSNSCGREVLCLGFHSARLVGVNELFACRLMLLCERTMETSSAYAVPSPNLVNCSNIHRGNINSRT